MRPSVSIDYISRLLFFAGESVLVRSILTVWTVGALNATMMEYGFKRFWKHDRDAVTSTLICYFLGEPNRRLFKF